MDIRTVRSTCGPLRSHPSNHPHVFRVFGIIRPRGRPPGDLC
jgi:hypothetical protein